MKSLARFVLFLLFLSMLAFGFVFTVNNTNTVPLWFGTVLQAQPLALWILLAFALGGILGLLLGLGVWRRLRVSLELKRLRAQVQQAESQLADLQRQRETEPVRSQIA